MSYLARIPLRPQRIPSRRYSCGCRHNRSNLNDDDNFTAIIICISIKFHTSFVYAETRRGYDDFNKLIEFCRFFLNIETLTANILNYVRMNNIFQLRLLDYERL